MKILCTLLIATVLGVTGASAQEPSTEKPEESKAKKVPAHTPEWTDHNEHDPGSSAPDEKVETLATPAKPAGTRVQPSQQKVLIMPSATQAEQAEQSSAGIRFGDGQHGRVPQKGDPDRPVISGRVANPEADKSSGAASEEKAETESGAEAEDDSGDRAKRPTP